jgi:hypothetical protein
LAFGTSASFHCQFAKGELSAHTGALIFPEIHASKIKIRLGFDETFELGKPAIWFRCQLGEFLLHIPSRFHVYASGPIQTEMFDRAFGEGETDMKKTIATNPGWPHRHSGGDASAVLWLSSPGAAFITGQDITVDGGYTAQ